MYALNNIGNTIPKLSLLSISYMIDPYLYIDVSEANWQAWIIWSDVGSGQVPSEPSLPSNRLIPNLDSELNNYLSGATISACSLNTGIYSYRGYIHHPSITNKLFLE